MNCEIEEIIKYLGVDCGEHIKSMNIKTYDAQLAALLIKLWRKEIRDLKEKI